MFLVGTSTAGRYCSNRIVEWILAACMLNWGLTTFATPATIDKGSFRYIGGQGLGIPWQVFAVVTTVAGALWIVGLIYNGAKLPWTARVRWLCATVSCLTLMYMALCLAFLTKDTDTVSLGVGSHFFWGLGALYSCLRAGLDATGDNSDRRTINVAVYDATGEGGGFPVVGGFGPVPDIAVHRRSNDGSSN